MTGDRADRYRRLLRWYSPQWRKANGEMTLGILLDAAEAEGRSRPSTREAASIAVHGVATRLDARSALAAAIAATAAAIAAGVISVFIPQIAAAGLGWIALTLSLVITPTLLAISAAGWLRQLGIFLAVRAVAIPVLTLAASAAALVTGLAWAAAFAAPDAGNKNSPLGLLWFAAAWLLASSALAVTIEAVLRRTRLPGAGRWIIAVAVGLIVAPVLGFSLLTPTVGVLAGITMVVILLTLRSRQVDPGASRAVQLDTGHTAPRNAFAGRSAPRALIAALAWGSVILGLGSVVFALTGSLWFDLAIDATEAMQLGITAGLVAAIPLVAAIALFLAARGRLGGVLPATLMIISLLIGAVASPSGITGFDPETTWVGFLTATLVAGAAVGATAHGMIRATPRARVWLSIAIGAGYAVTFGVILMLYIAFVAPLLGILFVTVWLRRGRNPLPLGPSAASGAAGA